MSDPLTDADDDASTPLTPDERAALIPSYITLRSELNEVEQIGIDKADEWAVAIDSQGWPQFAAWGDDAQRPRQGWWPTIVQTLAGPSGPVPDRLTVRFARVCRLVAVLAGLAVASHARAQTAAESASNQVPAAGREADSSLTFDGLTLYGTVDIGVAHLDHGAPLSPDHGPGLTFMIQKFSNRAITSVAPNGLSQSKIGLMGHEPLGDGVSVIFKLETGYQPTSGKLTDGPKSLIKSDGKPLDQQADSGDSSRAGQIFQGAAYVGLQSRTYGTLTYGWQNGVLLDDLQKYDPQLQSQAFSPIGTSGTAAGGGDTEDSRLDNSLKYAVQRGLARLVVLHQFPSHNGQPGTADEVDIGGDAAGFSLDGSLTVVRDAIAAASLNAAQAATHPGTLAATASNNTTWSLQGKYAREQAKLYAGYEHIEYTNPDHAIGNGSKGLGGYVLSVVNNDAFSHHRVLQISWVGMRYALTPALDITAAYYRYDQNSFKGNGCADRSATSCSGTMNAGSVVADYRLTRQFDMYLGVNASGVADGLASGFLKTSAVSQMGGVRFSF
ncbi:porin [Phenylobacterium sp.]|uniref:porin n=1 Tax=Phenylobacterium sp. TaxID=1871053 RepID=UPI002E343FCF|nr:porin [Phenylobacterium sp.]HEX3366019.1 porin [Phenylobacterium sp.]